MPPGMSPGGMPSGGMPSGMTGHTSPSGSSGGGKVKARKFCVENDASFSLNYHLENQKNDAKGTDSPTYGAGTTECQVIADLLSGTEKGNDIAVSITAVGGHTNMITGKVEWDENAEHYATFKCTGTTTSFDCP